MGVWVGGLGVGEGEREGRRGMGGKERDGQG